MAALPDPGESGDTDLLGVALLFVLDGLLFLHGFGRLFLVALLRIQTLAHNASFGSGRASCTAYGPKITLLPGRAGSGGRSPPKNGPRVKVDAAPAERRLGKIRPRHANGGQ